MMHSLLKTYLKKNIPQNLLLTENDFVKFADDRGVRVDLKALEYFEEKGLLFPLCRVNLPLIKEIHVGDEVRKRYAGLYDISHTLGKWFKEGHCEDPVEEEFRPWKKYKDGYNETARALYHPFQFLTLNTIVHWYKQPVSVPQLLDQKELEKIGGTMNKFWNSEEKWIDFIKNRVKRDLVFFPFLISIEDIYLPIIRSNFKGTFGEPDHGFKIWKDLRSKFNTKEALSEFKLSVEDLKNWRIQIAGETRHRDPLEKWYLLIRYTNYQKRQKLKGDALFAQDGYEIVELLGLFLEEMTGETQLGPDDLFDGFGGEWKKRIYGEEVDFVNRQVLRKLSYEYGLDYDYKILLFVEGYTEYNAIPLISDAMNFSFSKYGVRLERLDGYSEISPRRIQKLLEFAKSNNLIIAIIVDNHEHSKKYIDNLIDRGYLSREKDIVKIWNVDFEEDNFSIADLIQAINVLAEEKGIEIDLKTNDIKRRQKTYPNLGLGELLITVCEEQKFVLSKAKLGEALGNLLVEKIKKGNKEETQIEKELKKIAQALAKR